MGVDPITTETQVLDDPLLVLIHFPAISRYYRGALEFFSLSSPCCILDGDSMCFFLSGPHVYQHQDWVVQVVCM